jgi:hypothetical protein
MAMLAKKCRNRCRAQKSFDGPKVALWNASPPSEKLLKEQRMATNRLPSSTDETDFSLRARGLRLTNTHRREVRRILTTALGRFERRVRTVRVLLEDVNGPRGGVDNRCRIDIEFCPRGIASVSANASDEFAAAAKAANRARELVDRRVKKRRTRYRQPVRM